MTYDDTISLIDVRTTRDDYGDPVETETATEVLCNINGVSFNHDYQARSSGLKPEFTATMHRFEYSEEKLIEYNGQRYAVDRAYPLGTDEVELLAVAAKGVV